MASAPPTDAPAPTANWLGHLVERRRERDFVEAITEPIREDDDDAIVELLREHLAPAVFVEATVRDFLDRYVRLPNIGHGSRGLKHRRRQRLRRPRRRLHRPR
jgi:hypothetical protein